MILQTVIFHEIYYIELVCPVFPGITDTELKPLRIASGVVIRFKIKSYSYSYTWITLLRLPDSYLLSNVKVWSYWLCWK